MADPRRCAFFEAPVEVRHAIYKHIVGPSVHLMLRRGRLVLTKCTGASLRDEFPGYEAVQSRIQHIWARRLASSWGLHWACEEMACDNGVLLSKTPVMAFMFSCKQVFDEMTDFVLRTAVFHVSDLQTLQHLLQPQCLGKLAIDAPRVRKLCVSMRLPLLVCAAIEEPSLFATPDGLEAQKAADAWVAVLASLEQLSDLRRLDVWIDHDSYLPWSVVNERKMLHGLSSTAAHTVDVHLPELVPHLAKPGRHFTEPCAFTLHRRPRQDYIGMRRPDGSYDMSKTQDKPEVMELPGFNERQKEEWYETIRAKAAERSMHAYSNVVETHFGADMKWNC